MSIEREREQREREQGERIYELERTMRRVKKAFERMTGMEFTMLFSGPVPRPTSPIRPFDVTS
jgi:hypothetical protein